MSNSLSTPPPPISLSTLRITTETH
jgi:hypothetical protein